MQRTYIYLDDEEFCRVATQDGFDIRLMCWLLKEKPIFCSIEMWS